MCVLTMIAA
ncbi:hypothetical protein FXE76_05795 [Vibrio cholerae]|nr:hypothetical protein FXE76_05795 [Vibrio cholerae]